MPDIVSLLQCLLPQINATTVRQLNHIIVGSDALPPDQIYPFYRFPAKVQLDSQQLMVSGRNITLQSGMGVSTNIKIRERSVMSIFTDMFSSSVESLKTVR